MINIFNEYNIGLALSGGGARGFAHIGVLMALEKFDMRPNIISGVSAGAIVGSMYASGMSPIDILKHLTEIYSLIKHPNISLPKEGLFKLSKFGKLLDEWLPIKNIEETRIPLIICATDLDRGKPIGWSKGNIAERVMASCSIPVVFSPIKINGINYVDGGVLRNLPAWAIRKKCRKLIGSNCSPIEKNYEHKSSIIDTATRAFSLMAKSNTLQDILLCDYIIQSNEVSRYKMYDISAMKKITIHGYNSACRVLEKI